MATRITISLPENTHQQILTMADKENSSLSYTASRLLEIGLLVMNSNNENKAEKKAEELEEYCQKLIIQINGIVKEIALNKLNFDNEKIAQITSDTLATFNQLKGIATAGSL